MAKQDKFLFRKHDTIGAADAEGDKMFLSKCFVDTGDLRVLRDCSDGRSIVVGRTGSGKTALLQQLLETEERAIEVKPESLSLGYIVNSTIIQYLTHLGVNLDVFYKLLWRHVFAVEIIKRCFSINNDQDLSAFMPKVMNIIRRKKDKNALDYLSKWGKTFWQESEYRVKEITSNLEKEVKGTLGGKFGAVDLSLSGLRKLNEQQTGEVKHYAQTVVNKVQVRQLSDIIDLINEILRDPQKRYYVVIDGLDEDWIDDTLRYRLIHALIQCIRDFRKVRQAKIIAALRLDLLERIFHLVIKSGQQEEKYRALYLTLGWPKRRLVEVLDARIDYLVTKRYTKTKVSHQDLIPKTIQKERGIDFFIRRTLQQPRDVILFFNECIRQSEDQPVLYAKTILAAEAEYSILRFNALQAEWVSDYPMLKKFARILKKQKETFTINEMPREYVEDFCLSHLIEHPGARDTITTLAKLLVDDAIITPGQFLRDLFLIFYKVGLLGLKLETFEKYSWSTQTGKTVLSAEVSGRTRVKVHPAFHRVLGIKAAVGSYH